MTLRLYYSLAAAVLITAVWAVQAQTIGHVYVYVAICLLAAISLKFVVPYTWIMATALFVWWGVSVTSHQAVLWLCARFVIALLIGRNVF